MPSVEGKTACDDDGNGNRDADGTTSSSSIDSMQVKAVQLAGKSQHMCCSRRKRIKNPLVSSRPPVRLPEHPFGPVRRRW